MYYYIKGEFVKKGDSFIVIDAGGVGYKIYTSAMAIGKMPEVGEETKIYTYLHVREDTFDLYGFPTNDELLMFQNLISVSGVGPKVGLAILSVLTPQDIVVAIMKKDIKAITKAPGVGPKVAERIILELKNKIKDIDAIPEEYGNFDNSDTENEAVLALVSLGYSQAEAKKAVGLVGGDLGVEEIIKEALKKLMR